MQKITFLLTDIFIILYSSLSGSDGGAIIPLLMGLAADTFGIKLAFLIPILPYLYLSFYGFSGYKVVQPKTID